MTDGGRRYFSCRRFFVQKHFRAPVEQRCSEFSKDVVASGSVAKRYSEVKRNDTSDASLRDSD
jgi:hypothetical protein